jgi:hypothetical protein
MHGTRTRIGILSALLFALALPGVAAAQEVPRRAKVEVNLLKTPRSGATSTAVTMDRTLAVGESFTTFIRMSGDGSGSSGGGETIPPEIASAYAARGQSLRYTWRVQVTLASLAVDTATLDVDWQRADQASGTSDPVAGDRRTMTVRDGDRHVLDLVQTSPAGAMVASGMVQVTAMRLEDPAYADAKLAYDMWLVNEDSDGNRRTLRLQLSGTQGQAVRFVFAPLLPSLDAVATEQGPMKVTVDGVITGRLLANGTIDVTLRSARTVQLGAASGSEAGTKTFNAKPGETTSVELPSPTGFSRSGKVAIPSSPRPGVTVEGDQVRVDEGRFFAGTKTSILVTVHKQ